MEDRARIFDFRLIQRCASQLRIVGPKVGLFNNHWCLFFEDLAKQAAAKMRKGALGSTGRKAPIEASVTKKNPNAKYIKIIID